MVRSLKHAVIVSIYYAVQLCAMFFEASGNAVVEMLVLLTMTQRTKIIDDILTRGVAQMVDPAGAFRKKLTETPEQVIIKLGVDPTRPDLHIGHAVPLWKMRAMQELGAKVVFLVGDFTGQIGDPTGKSKVRPEVAEAEIMQNAQTYIDQVGKILLTDSEHFVWIRNSDWFVSVTDVHAPQPISYNFSDGMQVTSIEFPANSIPAKATAWEQTRMQPQFTGGRIETVTLINFLSILRRITHSRLIERDMFQDRLKGGDPLFMHEMMYPVLQGLDSLVIHKTFGACDIEMGGTDQFFNNMMGREIMEMHDIAPQAVLVVDLLEGTDGKEKMSKSLDNYIGISEAPTDMFGKTMRIPDSLIVRWVQLVTTLPAAPFGERLSAGENPRVLKAELASEIVRMYHGEAAAQAARAEFDRVHGADAGLPDDIPVLAVEEGSWNVVELLLTAKLVDSKSEARRLIEGGGVRLDSEKVTDITANCEVSTNKILLQIGKRRFVYLSSGV